MNCRKVTHFLSAYMDGELPGVEHRQIHEHIAQCPDCAKEYHGLLQMKRLLAGMRLREPQVDLPARIISQIHTQQDAQSVKTRTSWKGLITRWIAMPAPRQSVMALAASLAACGIIYASYAIDHSEQIVWHTTTPADIARLQPAPAGPSEAPTFTPRGGTQIGSSNWLPADYESTDFMPRHGQRPYRTTPVIPFPTDPRPISAP